MKSSVITLVILIILTIVSAIISNVAEIYLVLGVLLLAVLKFIGVSFYFMDMKESHTFWKGSILIFLVLFTTTILIIM